MDPQTWCKEPGSAATWEHSCKLCKCCVINISTCHCIFIKYVVNSITNKLMRVNTHKYKKQYITGLTSVLVLSFRCRAQFRHNQQHCCISRKCSRSQNYRKNVFPSGKIQVASLTSYDTETRRMKVNLWLTVRTLTLTKVMFFTVIVSGVRRLFEGQGRKEGHFSTRFGSHEGTLARVLAPKRAVYHVLTSQGGSLVCFANQDGTLARFFGSQEGTLAHVLALRRAL